MADVRIAKPEAGESRDIASIPQANFVFDFATDDATISRDGDNLLIRFSDGSQVNLQNFYAEYNSENLPSFELEGERVEAKDFFAAMNEPDLMPAAGPGAASATVMRNARYSESSSSELGGGLEHLGGLDYGIEYDTNGMTGLASEAAGATTFPNAAANIVNEGQGAISTTILPPTIAITAIGDNGTINIARSENPFTTITGTVGGGARPGDVVTIRIPGSNNEYNAIVRDDLTWEVVVNTPDLIMGEEIEATITIRDENGNSITETITRPVDVDVTPPTASITINPVAGDDIIDASEAQAEFTTITGAVGGDVKPGDTITVTIEGSNTPYITTVKPDLTWEVEVPTKELVDGGEIEATVTTTDEAGNEATARDEREFEVVATPDTPDNPENPGKPGNPDTPDIPGNVDKPENPENPDEPDNPGVQDPVTTTATIVANHTTEGGDGNAQFTVSLSNPAAADATVIIEVNGQNYTGKIKAGQSSVTINVPHDNDEDVYIDPSTITATLVGIMGGDFEKLVIGENQSATSVIDDTIDTTTVKLAASEIVAEGKLITVTATVNNAPLDDLTITLESGETITIKAGDTSGSIKVESRPDDAIVNGETSKTFAIKDVTGGDRYEKLVVDNTAVTTTITDDGGAVEPENPDPDDPSTTVITLTATESVVEGGQITLTVTANHDIGNEPVTVKLSNGVEITIPAGEKSASITVDSRVDDYYVQGTETLTTTIVGVSGGSDLEYLTYSKASATTTVTDDKDVTTITLSATPAVVEGGMVTVTATVDNAPQDTPLVITLSNGQTITIDVDDLEGEVSFQAGTDDNLKNAGDITLTITDARGGNYEALDKKSSFTVEVTDRDPGEPVDPENPDPDDPSTTVITLTATESVDEGGQITLTATANHNIGKYPVTVTLSNGKEITIPAGGKSASITVDSRVDDYYVQGTETLTTTIVGVSGGSDLEYLTYSKAPATTMVKDDLDLTSVTLTAPDMVKEGESIVVEVKLNHTLDESVFVKLTNGDVIEIQAGELTGKKEYVSRENDTVKQEDEIRSFQIESVTCKYEFEKPEYTKGEVKTIITDNDDDVVSMTVYEGGDHGASTNVSQLFPNNQEADGGKSPEYRLVFDGNANELTALINGKELPVTLNDTDGAIIGTTEKGDIVVTISVDSSGEVRLQLADGVTLKHSAQDEDTINISTIKVERTVAGNDGGPRTDTINLDLKVVDDAPSLKATDPNITQDIEPGQYLVSSNNGPFMFVTGDKTTDENNSTKSINSDILQANWDNVTITAGKLTYTCSAGGDGTENLVVTKLETPDGYELRYSGYPTCENSKPSADYGVMVYSPATEKLPSWDSGHYETGVLSSSVKDNVATVESEAIIIDLGGQIAKGITLTLGAFYQKYGDEESAEMAMMTFYRNEEVVETRLINSVDLKGSKVGQVTLSKEFNHDGFDKVVISGVSYKPEGVDTPRDSNFTLQGVDFITVPNPIQTATGDIMVDSGADSYGAGFETSHVQFAMEQMFKDGKSLQVMVGGEEKTAMVTVSRDSSGNSFLQAKVDNTDLFSVMLERKNDGKWSWKLEQYGEFVIPDAGMFALEFITQDGDGDIETASTQIQLFASNGISLTSLDHVDANDDLAWQFTLDDAWKGNDSGEEGALITPTFARLDVHENNAIENMSSTDDNYGFQGGAGDDTVGDPAGVVFTVGAQDDTVRYGTEGDDLLFGGLGDDTIRGGAGDDYIAGGEGRDIMFGEDGNDIIYMDLSDYLVDGGNDIDFALLDANENNPTLAEMLANGMAATDEVNHDIPMVRDVEVLLTGEVSGIRNAEDLAERHIELGTDGDGNSIIRLGEGWKKAGSMTEDDAAKTQTWENGSLTLETTLDVQAVHAALEDAASSLQANESIATQSDIQLTPEYQNINDGNA